MQKQSFCLILLLRAKRILRRKLFKFTMLITIVLSNLFLLVFMFSYSNGTITHQLYQSTNSLLNYIQRENERGEKGLAYNWLEEFVDTFGHRLVGSESLEKSIDFIVERLTQDGFDNVHTEEVKDLPHWVRDDDRVTMLEPRYMPLQILAMGLTPAGNVTAPVVVVEDLEELQSENIVGKIVLVAPPSWTSYGKLAKTRYAANLVKNLGGIGLLVKSIAPFSFGTPHTGNGEFGTKIPAACVTLEEAELIKRLSRKNQTVVVNMNIKSREIGKTTSRNVIFEITGKEKPNEIVLVSAHIDSWDVGQGAMDDGGGMAAIWQAMRTIKLLADKDPNLRPRRTIRGVFWTSEEIAYLGSKYYYEEHKKFNSETFFFVSESDQGAFRPTTWESYLAFSGSAAQKTRIEEITHILQGFGIPLSVNFSKTQIDVVYWANDGVPAINYVPEKHHSYYFNFHHTYGDYITVFKEDDLQYTAMIFSALAHVIANMNSWE